MTDFNPFNYVDGKVTIDNSVMVALPPFKKILDKDKNNDKKVAFTTFLYLYLYCDLRSILNKRGYSDKETHKEAVRLSGIQEDELANSDVTEAIDTYKKFTGTVQRDIYLTLKRSFNSAGKVLEKSRELLEETIEKEDITPEDIRNCQVALKEILNLASDIPSKFKALDEIENIINKDAVKLRGDKVKRKSHDPENELGQA